ncbi:nurim homolog isoform X3 [Ceratina calcarata]|uniref:Nuclear envelope membrane protein n=1 Tax=Ceratina calcarata TaxID=156304 RepID=A0AAJ7IS42_9HYME|nr:nurim homolog isoform X3 [Ceratina calcarata]
MFVKWFSVVTCTVCFLYTIYILYSLGHFLSNHNVTNETIVSSKEDESNVSLLWPLSTDMTLGCLMMDLSELAGLKQVYYKFSSRPCPIVMKSRGLLRYYMHMRHPSLTGFLIIFWIHPYMTLDRLLLASILTIYMGLMWTIDKEDYDYHAHLVKLKQNELL